MSTHERMTGVTSAAAEPTPRTPCTIDVSHVSNSIQALRAVEEYLTTYADRGNVVDIRMGQLLLTRGIFSKIAMLFRKYAVRPGTVYSGVPQTQQAALDEGFSVREKPAAHNPVSFDVSRNNAVSFTPDGIDLPGVRPSSSGQSHKSQASQVPGSDAVERSSQRFLDIVPPAPPPRVEAPDVKPEAYERTGVQYNEDEILAEARRVAASFGVTLPDQGPKAEYTSEQDVVSQYVPSVAIDDLVQAFDHELAAEESPTLFLKQTLRSGQVVRFNGSIVVIGDAHAGSEIAASGDIVVWGELRGIAHAGVGGGVQTRAEIRAMKIDALQLRIGDVIARRPDRISYHKPSSSAVLAPELAKVQEGEIRIFQESV